MSTILLIVLILLLIGHSRRGRIVPVGDTGRVEALD